MTRVVEIQRRSVDHGDNVIVDFDFTDVMPPASTIDPDDVTVTIKPDAEVIAAPAIVSGLVVQITFDTTGAEPGQREYEVDVLAESGEGIKKHLFVVLDVHPPMS